MEICQPKSLINLKKNFCTVELIGHKVPIGYKRNATAGELPKARRIDRAFQYFSVILHFSL